MFGANKSTFGAFGSTAPGSSLFSQNKPVGVAFGTPQTSAQPAGGLFGAPSTSSNMFGSTPSNTTSLFGSSNQQSVFGQTAPAQSSGLFGASSFGTSTAPTQQTSAFGSFNTPSTASSSLFNKPTTGGMFGSTPAPATGGLFGSAGAGVNGSSVKFDAPTAQDTMMKNSIQTSINIKHQCITAMKVYEGKSIEELRVQDYLANRKGSSGGGGSAFGVAQPAPSTGGLFGSTAPASTVSGGLFGSTQNKPLFGAAAAAPTSSGLFGATGGGGGLFGSATTAQKPLFGASTTTASSGFAFGATNTAPPATGGGLFGAAAPKPAFGAPATGGLFGASGTTQPQTGAFSFANPAQPQAGGLFGASKPGLFGATSTAPSAPFSFNTPSSAFGAVSTQAGGLFGAKPAQPTFGGFGAQPAAGAFGTPQQSAAGGLFGSTAKPGLFSTPATGTGLFSTQQTAPTFGATAPKPGTFNFGSTAPPGAGFSFAGAQQAPGSGLFGTQAGAQPISIGTDPSTAATQQLLFEQQIRALGACPYGDTPLMKLLNSSDEKKRTAPTDPAAQRRVLNEMEHKQRPPVMSTGSPYLRSALGNSVMGSLGSPSLTRRLSMPKSTPRILTAINRSASFRDASRDSSFVDDLDADESLIKKGFIPKKNPKKLVIRPKITTESTVLPSPILNIREESPSMLPYNRALTEVARNGGQTAPPPLNLDATSDTTINNNTTTRTIRDTIQSSYQQASPDSPAVSDWNDESRIASPPPEMTSPKCHPAGIVLRRQGYYTIPSLQQLASITSQSKCIVKNGFTVGRKGYGSVFWPGETDVTGLNLDELVHFRHKEVTVYPDDNTKPEENTQLNKPAEVTLNGVWPISKTDKLPIKDLDRLEEMGYRKRLEIAAARMDATFIDYRPETGSWVFKVPHFSKYGLAEAEDDDNMDTGKEQNGATQNLVQRTPINKSPLKDTNMPFTDKNTLQLPKEIGLGGIDIASPDYIDKETEPEGFYDMELTTPFEQIKGGKVSQLKSAFFDESRDMSMSHLETKKSRMSCVSRMDESDMDVVQQITQLYKKSALMQDSLASDPYSELYDEVKKYGTVVSAIDTLVDDMKVVEAVHRVPVDMGYNQRFLCNRSNLNIDEALFNNIRFRPCISSEMFFVCPESGNERPMAFGVQTPNIGCKMTRLNVNLIETETSITQDVFEQYMSLELEHSEMTPSPFEGGCPLITPLQGIHLLKKWAEPDSGLPKTDGIVWNLCWALWGDYPLIQDVDGEYVYAREMIRREAVCNWLIDATQTQLEEARFKSKTKDTNGELSWCVIYMEYGRLDEAAEEAMQAGNPRLALTIASAHDPQARQLLQQQLFKWKDNGVDEFIDNNRLALYIMCAGLLEWTSSDNRHMVICEKLNWKAAFAYHMHLVCSPHSSVCDVLLSYEESVSNGLAPQPTPYYLLDNESIRRDVCYQLMQLYSNKAHPLAPLLDPSSYSPSLFDYHLGWHLWSVLHSIGYRHMSENSTCTLHSAYARQLQMDASCKWAANVLLHIKDQYRRDESIQELLNMNVNKLEHDELEFINQRLDIPQLRIATAKLILSRNNGNKEIEAWLTLDAHNWNEAHRILNQYLGPVYIVNDKLDCLEDYVDRLSCHSDRIRDWAVGGFIFDQFIRCKRRLDAIRETDMEEGDMVEEMKPVLMSLISKIGALKDKTPMQQLAQAEISKFVCNFVCVLLPPEEVDSLLPVLTKLSMPDDYTLDFCSLVTKNCLRS